MINERLEKGVVFVTVFVCNCFNWVGFHLVQILLENGYCVEGIDDLQTDKQNHLSMFMGRQANFQLLNASQGQQAHSKYDLRIQVNASGSREEKQNGSLEIIQGQQGDTQVFTIALPLLFGSWMPMTEAGMFRVNGEWVLFDSTTFAQEAFYIENYMGLLVHWIEQKPLKTQYSLSRKISKTPDDSEMIQTDNVICNDLKETQVHFLNNRSFY